MLGEDSIGALRDVDVRRTYITIWNENDGGLTVFGIVAEPFECVADIGDSDGRQDRSLSVGELLITS